MRVGREGELLYLSRRSITGPGILIIESVGQRAQHLQGAPRVFIFCLLAVPLLAGVIRAIPRAAPIPFDRP